MTAPRRDGSGVRKELDKIPLPKSFRFEKRFAISGRLEDPTAPLRHLFGCLNTASGSVMSS
jgi:hypothetical protein